jgi:geranylgeranyl diphosphate synthase type I
MSPTSDDFTHLCRTVLRDVVVSELRPVVDRLHPRLRAVAYYHLGWADTHGNPRHANGGKLLRPTLALLCAAAATGELTSSTPAAVPAAVAVQLVHEFSLLHDDIIDRDRARRGRATAWVVFGEPLALLTGNALMVSAIQSVLDAETSNDRNRAEALRELTTALENLMRGQGLDVTFESARDVTGEQIDDMVAGKTTALLVAGCVMGPILAGLPATDPRVGQVRRFGEYVGLAFQLTDDLLGIWGNPRVTGKPAGADLIRRKKTLPITWALTSGTPAGEQLRDRYEHPAPQEPDAAATEARELRELVELAGGREWARDRAQHQLGAAQDVVDELEPPATVASALRYYISSLLDRTV